MKISNILHIIGSDFYGGPEKQIIEHLRILDKNKYNGHIASFFEGGKTSNQVLDIAKSYDIPSHSIVMKHALDVNAISLLKEIITNNDINLIVTHGYKSAVLGVIVSKKCKIPVIAFSHGYTTENFKVSVYEWLERKALEQMKGVIAVSHAQKKRLDNFKVKYKKCWVVHNATTVDGITDNKTAAKETICKELEIPLNKKIAVIAGRLSPEKAHNILLDAAHLIKDKLDDTVIIICGDGQNAEVLKKQTITLGLEKICIFAGFRNDVETFYQAMDFMILSSLTEGLPLVVLEAMAHSKPVVSTSVGGVPEVIIDGENGYLVQSGNAEALAEGISRALDQFDQFTEIGQKAHDLIKDKFSFTTHATKLETIYAEVLD